MDYTEQEMNEIRKENDWNPTELDMFRNFIGMYPEAMPEDWELEEIADAVDFFFTAKDAFWSMNEITDRAELIDFMASYDLQKAIDAGHKTLEEHFVKTHDHYYQVYGGYVFFAE